MYNDNYAAYLETTRALAREGNTMIDDEFENLAARDKAERLLKTEYTPPKRPSAFERTRTASFCV